MSQGGTSILGGGGLASKFASEILVGDPNFASKNLGDKYPKFCPLNFRFDPKIGIFPQLLRLVIRSSQVFPLIWCRTWLDLSPNFASELDVRSKPPPPPPPRPPNMAVPPGLQVLSLFTEKTKWLLGSRLSTA